MFLVYFCLECEFIGLIYLKGHIKGITCPCCGIEDDCWMEDDLPPQNSSSR